MIRIAKFKRAAFLLGSCISTAAIAQQSSVQLYGILDAVVGSFKPSGASGSSLAMLSGGQTTSFYGIRGSEDLGGGLRANFAVEGYLLLNSGQSGRFAGDNAYSRNTYVGLSGQWGEIRAGRLINPLFFITARTNSLGGSTRFSPLMVQTWIADFGRAVAGDTSWDSAVSYESPAIAGTKVTVQYGIPGSGAHDISAAVVYDQGPLYASAVAQRTGYGPGFTPVTSHQNVYFVGVTYKFQYLSLSASFDRTLTYPSGRSTKTWQTGFSIPIGVSSIGASWARTDLSAATTHQHRDTAGLTYNYPLSKRTDTYLSYLYDKLSTAGTGNTFGVGLRHRF
ncbi:MULTISPECIES: porin [unclassified Burkholderia]|uniref:porin n=1 Tax=unclassified Burkholderia TaxID=2613784 RepID=UPI000B79C050|nr:MULTISPECIES: porin [unclassified Burkholderia]MBN3732986.1 porin [Burkholderia sp. Tr-20390]OXJ08845.1 porin [Burkholderia sp. AU6039]